CMQGIQVPYTC
nr:immunoglobulin light chain junction region [Macaca mulatta]